MLDRRDGGLGRVGDVDERPDAASVADHRELALPHHLELLLTLRQRRAWAVEDPVAQDDPVSPPCAENGRLEMTERGQGLAELGRRRRVERIRLRLHRGAGAPVHPEARHPLRHDRRTPTAWPAESRLSVPSVRRRLVGSAARSVKRWTPVSDVS